MRKQPSYEKTVNTMVKSSMKRDKSTETRDKDFVMFNNESKIDADI